MNDCADDAGESLVEAKSRDFSPVKMTLMSFKKMKFCKVDLPASAVSYRNYCEY